MASHALPKEYNIWRGLPARAAFALGTTTSGHSVVPGRSGARVCPSTSREARLMGDGVVSIHVGRTRPKSLGFRAKPKTRQLPPAAIAVPRVTIVTGICNPAIIGVSDKIEGDPGKARQLKNLRAISRR